MTYNAAVKKFLEDNQIAVLSLRQESGPPHSATVHYAWYELGGQLIFFTRTGTLKYKILQKLERVPAAVVIGFSQEEFVTIQMHGEVTVTTDTALQETYLQRFARIRKFLHDDDAIFLSFLPQWIRYSDLKTSSPIIYEFKK